MRRSFPAAGKALEILKRGFSLELSGRLKEAEYHYQLVLRDFPDHPEALNMLGTLASKAGNHGIAIECLSKAVAAQPKNMIFRNNLGYCLNAAKKARELSIATGTPFYVVKDKQLVDLNATRKSTTRRGKRRRS